MTEFINKDIKQCAADPAPLGKCGKGVMVGVHFPQTCGINKKKYIHKGVARGGGVRPNPPPQPTLKKI